MSYQVLARKWRPSTFQEMVGQEHVLRMLTNALDNQRLHHAYLFTGTRGVGKTSLARLLAKCLNCETGITSNPCGTCSACVSITAGKFLDLLEIDAASRTKVEDTRELLDNVQYAPTQGRFKIYLIDEVHMLSGHSFNALLKTLEEPPAHVKFILATTDPKRLPVTILSRCLQFNLKRVPVEQISKQLQHICTEEKIQFEVPALEQLAEAADGSMRDALSLLDQAIAFCRESITTDDTRRMLGNVEQDSIYRLLTALSEKNGANLLAEIAALAEHAPDFHQLCENIISVLQRIAILQVVPDSDEKNAALIALSEQLSAEDVQLYYQIALIGRRDLSLSPNPKQGFEMIMLRMLAFQPSATEPQKKVTAQNTAMPIAEKKITEPTKPVTAINTIANDEWHQLIPKLGLTGMGLALASNCAQIDMSDTDITLALSHKHEPMLNAKLIERLEAAIKKCLNKTVKLHISISSDELNTSAKKQEQTKKDRHASAVKAITTDHDVKKIMDVFGATLDVDSVKAID
ncbi:MAG: DNA polymerase III subunit gamma/tau [Gammaproteobacteria bacterium]|nr:DNA polymerase III subunit gamma/tau [Gammaproteobacteria bacterium]